MTVTHRPRAAFSSPDAVPEPGGDAVWAEAGQPPDPPLADPCAEREVMDARLHSDDGREPGLDVFLTGTVFMDMIFTGLPGLPPPGTELYSAGLGSAPGGVANMAVAMSRLGLRVGLASGFGDDMFGQYLWRTLAEQEGVDLSLARRLPRWPTPVTVSMAYAADRGMVTHHRPLPVPDSDLVTEPPRARTCFVELERPIPDWALRMRADGTWIVADVGWDATETWSGDVLKRLANVDVFLPNAVEAMAYTRTADPETAARRLAELAPLVVVKCGAAGAIAIDGVTGEYARADALPVTALDPTGAGDVFAAGFVFATLAEWPLPQRLKFANLCAGLSVRHYSGSLGAPCWGEIAAFGESAEVPPEVLEEYGFVVSYIPESAVDSVTRAEPTVGYGTSLPDAR
jgi:sugar/nucleoside kinase (ribokinase family)